MLRQHQPDRVPHHQVTSGIGTAAALATPLAGGGDTHLPRDRRHRCIRGVPVTSPGGGHSADQAVRLITAAIPTTVAAVISTTGTTVPTSFILFIFGPFHGFSDAVTAGKQNGSTAPGQWCKKTGTGVIGTASTRLQGRFRTGAVLDAANSEGWALLLDPCRPTAQGRGVIDGHPAELDRSLKYKPTEIALGVPMPTPHHAGAARHPTGRQQANDVESHVGLACRQWI